VIARFYRKKVRLLKRWARSNRLFVGAIVAVLIIGTLAYTSYMQNKRLAVNPATYTSLLQLIATVESKGNYNAYFGNASNTSIDFTKMSIKEVMQWQADFVRQGSASSAVGRYQIVDTTLAGLVRQLHLSTAEPFGQATQDKLAIALLERRGAERYVNGELTRDQFAANLAMEWAALPKVIGDNPNDSYYASDGLNRSLVSVDDVRNAIEPISP